MGRPGKMKRRIDIYQVSSTTDILGGQTASRSLIKTTWAKVEQVGGTRALEYLQTKNQRAFTITMRKDLNVDLNPNQIIIQFNNKDLIIESINENLDNFMYQDITATEKIV